MEAGEETRDAAGRFLPGKSGNPDGTARPWQPFGVRCQHWLNKMTRRELRELAQNEEEMDKLSSYDAMVITALVGTMAGKEKGRERERVLDRIEGKPTQTFAGDSDRDPINLTFAKILNEIDGRTSGLPSAEK